MLIKKNFLEKENSPLTFIKTSH